MQGWSAVLKSAAFERLSMVSGNHWPKLGPEQLVESLPDDPIAGETKELLRLFVCQHIAVGGDILHEYGCGHMIKDCVQEAFDPPQFVLSSLLFGNVLMNCDPSAVLHWLVADRKYSAITQFVLGIVRFPRTDFLQTQVNIVASILRAVTRRHARLQDRT